MACLAPLMGALFLVGCGAESSSPAPPTVAPSGTRTTSPLGSPVVPNQAAPVSTAINGVVAQAVAFAVSQRPPTRNLHVDIVSRNGTAAQALAHFEMWSADSQTWTETSVDVSLDLVDGGWRISTIGPILTTAQASAIAEETSTVVVAAQTSVSVQAVTAEFTLQTGPLVQTPGIGIGAPVSVTNHDVHDHSVAISVEVDLLLRDPTATGWWTLTGVMTVSAPAGSTQSVMVALTGAPYAFSDEQTRVLKLLQTEPPADSTETRVNITSVDGVVNVSATPAP